jgi:IclR family acetate operon transcriptional repressor
MAVRVADKVWPIDKVSSPQPLRGDHPVGALAPLHCAALAKARLAVGNHIEASEVARCTDRTILDRASLEADLAECRRRGSTTEDEGFGPGVRSR